MSGLSDSKLYRKSTEGLAKYISFASHLADKKLSDGFFYCVKTDIVEGKYLIIVGGVMKKFNMLINLIIVFGAGVFVESLFAAYRDFINHPEVYEINSAPWYYYSAVPNAVAFVAFIILCLLLKLAIHKRVGRIILGVIAVGIPTFIIGVCQSAHMHCHMVTRPALILIGVIVGLTGILSLGLKLVSNGTEEDSLQEQAASEA